MVPNAAAPGPVAELEFDRLSLSALTHQVPGRALAHPEVRQTVARPPIDLTRVEAPRVEALPRDSAPAHHSLAPMEGVKVPQTQPPPRNTQPYFTKTADPVDDTGDPSTIDAMARNLLDRLLDRLAPDMLGLVRTTDGLEHTTQARYGEVAVVVSHDVEAEMLRVAVAVPPPAGGGVDFLLWCMNQNAVYWDVKFGIDGRGLLVIHSDLDAHRALDIEDLATAVFERSQTVIELLDDDYVEWLLDNRLVTTAQAQAWAVRGRPEAPE